MPRKKSDAAKRALRAVADIPQQLAALRNMTVAELRERYREVFGEPTRSRNKDWLRKKIAWRIQELAEGGLSERALARIEELADGAPLRRRSSGNGAAEAPTAGATDQAASRDPRLPEPGTVLTRMHEGVEHTVTVLDDGFEYRGERYASLSKIAREISGTNWNGFLYFGLQRRTRKGNGGTA
ncbi:MAG: DUF2924 domain-containing protein [Myxococcales bacterium]|nr:DUF2924 domain-containing protein [Myxococcales bacterium]